MLDWHKVKSKELYNIINSSIVVILKIERKKAIKLLIHKC